MLDVIPVRNTVSGTLATDCPEPLVDSCYVECELTRAVYDSVQAMPEQRPNLSVLIESMCVVAEQALKEMCEDVPTLCFLAFGLGIDCVQCQIVSKKFSPCVKTVCDLQVIDPCSDVCAPVCNTRCLTKEIDLTETQEGLDLLTSIVTAIVTVKPICASWSGIQEIAQAVLGAGAEVVAFKDNTYYLNAGRELTEFELSMLPFIISALPAPIGTTIEFVK